jgi:hypothetical protein
MDWFSEEESSRYPPLKVSPPYNSLEAYLALYNIEIRKINRTLPLEEDGSLGNIKDKCFPKHPVDTTLEEPLFKKAQSVQHLQECVGRLILDLKPIEDCKNLPPRQVTGTCVRLSPVFYYPDDSAYCFIVATAHHLWTKNTNYVVTRVSFTNKVRALRTFFRQTKLTLLSQ